MLNSLSWFRGLLSIKHHFEKFTERRKLNLKSNHEMPCPIKEYDCEIVDCAGWLRHNSAGYPDRRNWRWRCRFIEKVKDGLQFLR